jgi:AcrR family transcriptional regulator
VADDTRDPLSRDRIIDAAIALADADGLNGLSMRKVAAELGFEVMSLYNHVSNKQDLLRAMVERVTTEVEMASADTDWQAAIRQHSIDTKEMFARHPWVVGLWASTIPGPNRFDQMEWTLATLERSGLDDHQAHNAFHAIGNHVVGYMLSNIAMPGNDGDLDRLMEDVMASIDEDRHINVIKHIQQHADGDSGPSFEFVLDLLIAGIAAS